MTSTIGGSTARKQRSVFVVVLAWLVAGTLDITAAILYYVGLSPSSAVRLLQGIASGVLGARAFTGGVRTALLGLALHYFIALIWTLVIFVALRRIATLHRRLVLTGIVYGVVVWFVMNVVVLPLSRVQHQPIQPAAAAIAAIILILCIGLPLSIIIGHHLRNVPAA